MAKLYFHLHVINRKQELPSVILSKEISELFQTHRLLVWFTIKVHHLNLNDVLWVLIKLCESVKGGEVGDDFGKILKVLLHVRKYGQLECWLVNIVAEFVDRRVRVA